MKECKHWREYLKEMNGDVEEGNFFKPYGSAILCHAPKPICTTKHWMEWYKYFTRNKSKIAKISPIPQVTHESFSKKFYFWPNKKKTNIFQAS